MRLVIALDVIYICKVIGLIIEHASVSHPKGVDVGEHVNLKCISNEMYDNCTFSQENTNRSCNFISKKNQAVLTNVEECNNANFSSKVEFFGSVSMHECEIKLNDVSLQDEGTWRCNITSNGETSKKFLNVTVLDDLPSPIGLAKPTKMSQLTTSSEIAKTSSITDNRTAIFEAINDLTITQIQPTVTSNPTTVVYSTTMMSKETTREANINGTIIDKQDSKVQIIVNVQGGENSEKSNQKRDPKSFDAAGEIQRSISFLGITIGLSSLIAISLLTYFIIHCCRHQRKYRVSNQEWNGTVRSNSFELH